MSPPLSRDCPTTFSISTWPTFSSTGKFHNLSDAEQIKYTPQANNTAEDEATEVHCIIYQKTTDRHWLRWLFSQDDYFLYQCFIVPHRKFRSPHLGKAQQPLGQCYPFLSVSAVFSCVQTMVWLSVFGIFNMHTDADACDCTRGLYRHCKSLHSKLPGGGGGARGGGVSQCPQTRVSTVPSFSVWCSTNWAIPSSPVINYSQLCWGLQKKKIETQLCKAAVV